MKQHPSDEAEVRVLASPNNWIEGTAEQQLKKTASLAGMQLAVGLPDLHPGKGSPIGAAFAVEGRIYPALVGNDIGCGVGLWQTSLQASKTRRAGMGRQTAPARRTMGWRRWGVFVGTRCCSERLGAVPWHHWRWESLRRVAGCRAHRECRTFRGSGADA